MNSIRIAIADGRPALGIWALLPSSLSAEILGRSGIEWLLLDTQHGGIAGDGLIPTIQALELGGACALVRVRWCDPAMIMQVLDAGAAGVVVPMVSTAEDALLAARAARYPPEGNRSFGPTRNYRAPEVANQDVLCMAMIETAEAIQNLDAIAATPGIDGLFVGPMDLALSMGSTTGVRPIAPEVLDAIDKVVAVCEANGIIPGVAAITAEMAEQMLGTGMRLLAVGSDVGYLRQGAQEDLGRIRTWSEAHRVVRDSDT